MAVIYVKYIAVTGKSASRSYLQRYLYDHTKVIDHQDSGDMFTAICRTESPESEANVQFLADYQAGRLLSGLMGATVHDSISAAADHLHGDVPAITAIYGQRQ